MPRFVVLHHTLPTGGPHAEHWDLMLQDAEVLLTWALAEPPGPDRSITAQRLADHRLAYLDYEGPLSDNRGTVAQWDSGHYETSTHSRTLIVVRVCGRRIAGRLTLTADPHELQRWTALFEPDASWAV